MFSTYGANAPSIFLDIDREKAQALGITLNDVFTTLQSTLGGYFINNFNLFGRTWQVNLQAEAADRRDISALWKIYIRNAKGDDGAAALDRLGAHRHRPAGHHALQQLPLGDHQRRPRAGRGLGHGAGRHGGGFGQDACRPATPSNGPARPIRSKRASGQTVIVLGLALLFAFLFLVALYESWIIPIPVLFSVMVGVLGAIGGVLIARPHARSLCADRAGRSDRAGGEERHPDRRVRQGTARARVEH